MNILLIHNYYRSQNIGGEDRVFATESEFLEENDHLKVFKLTFHTDRARWYSILLGALFRPRVLRKVRRSIQRNDINIVHLHNTFPLLSVAPIVAAKLEGVPVVQTLHNFRYWCPKGTLFRNGKICMQCFSKRVPYPSVIHRCIKRSTIPSLYVAVSTMVMRALGALRLTDAFFTLTPSQSTVMLGRLSGSASRVLVKPNIVSESVVSGQVPVRRNGVLFVGRFEEEKGIRHLVNAINQMSDHVFFRLVGTGPLLEQTKKNLQDRNVEFLGLRSPAQVRHLMANSRYLLQTSVWLETFGLTIVEAMAEGCPVIGFPIGTRKDLIVDHHNGFLCEPEDLARTIEYAMQYPQYDSLSENAREFSRAFHPAPIVELQLDHYTQIIRRLDRTAGPFFRRCR